MDELKPCPFCGDKPKIYICSLREYIDGKPKQRRGYQIYCPGCGIETPKRFNKEGNIKAWNMRVNDENR